MSKLLRVSNSKYRVVVSDVLPYERPIFFTNRFYARLLKYYGVVSQEDTLIATRHAGEPGLKEFLQILSGWPGASRPCFQYNVTKDGHEEGRCLSVVHPFHQVKMVEFYDKYKMLLIDFCQRSNFSIRYPYKIASYQKKQKGYHKIMSDDAEPVDTHESLKHFFAYKHYKNINFFYGDYRFLRAEKKFVEMTKLDLEHCFDNITPKSLSMAMFHHEINECPHSIASEFYELQRDFHNNTAGIVIGPEFSRICAEIVLQRIDLDVERDLEQIGIFRNIDYVFYRYVDDGFLFFNEMKVKEKFFHVYWNALSQYGLRIKKSKILSFKERPFLENISIAKQHLLQLMNDRFENRLRTFKGFVKMQNKQIDTPTKIDFKSFVNEVRNICAQGNGLKYKDITSFLLGIIQTRLMRLLEAFNDLYGQYTKAIESGSINEQGLKIKERYEHEFIDFSMNIIEILFYFLCCDMRMGTSIKTVSIINKLQIFVRGTYDIGEFTRSNKFPQHCIERLDDKISDEIRTLFLNITPKPSNMMEALNVLELEKIMSQKSRIAPKVLTDFWMRCENKSQALNFFTVFEFIHYIKDSQDYSALTPSLYQWIENEISSLQNKKMSRTEAVLTFVETMCCPWIDKLKKKKYATDLFGPSSDKVYNFAEKQKNMFVQWRNYKVDEAILQMNNEEVY